MSLLFALSAVVATCTPNPAFAGSGEERVRAYLAAVDTRNAAAIGLMITPDSMFGNRDGLSAPLHLVMTNVLTSQAGLRLRVTEVTARGSHFVAQTRANDQTTTEMTVTLDGGCVKSLGIGPRLRPRAR